MFFCLLAITISVSCQHSVFINTNEPQDFTFPVDEGEHICINTSMHYLTVIFHNSLLNVRYFLPGGSGNFVEVGKFSFPSEKGGISFGIIKGSVDILSLIPASVSFSVFAFPGDCSDGRYVTTEKSKEINIKSIFGDFHENQHCIWYPQKKYTLSINEAPEKTNSINICPNPSDCHIPFSRTLLNEKISKPYFVLLKLHTQDYYERLTLFLEAEELNIPFEISALLESSGHTALSIISPQKPSIDNNNNNIEKNEKDDKVDKDNDDDKDDDENRDANKGAANDNDENNNNNNDDDFKNKQKNKDHADINPLVIPPPHGKRESSARFLSTGELVAMFAVIIAVFIIIAQCFCCDNMTSRNRPKAVDQSEVRLLGAKDSSFNGNNFNNFNNNNGNNNGGFGPQSFFGYPQQFFAGPAFAGPQQMPMTGVFFPPTPGGETDDNQNQQQEKRSNEGEPQLQSQQLPQIQPFPQSQQQQQQQYQQQLQQQFQQQYQQQQLPQSQSQLQQLQQMQMMYPQMMYPQMYATQQQQYAMPQYIQQPMQMQMPPHQQQQQQ